MMQSSNDRSSTPTLSELIARGDPHALFQGPVPPAWPGEGSAGELDVCFVNPFNNPGCVTFMTLENLGVSYIASVLERFGFSTDLVDCQLSNLRPREAAAEIVARRPRVVGITLLTFMNEAPGLEIVHHLRELGYDGRILLGGKFATIAHEKLARVLGDRVDAVCVGEGEVTTLDLLDRWRRGAAWRDAPGISYWHGGRTHQTPHREMVDPLDVLPYPKRFVVEPIVAQAVPLSVVGTRGCWYGRCTFCSVSTLELTLGKSPARRRTPKALVEEMVSLAEETGSRDFVIISDSFVGPGPKGRRELDEFIEELAAVDPRLRFSFACQPLDVRAESFGRLKDVGLTSVFLGIETGSSRTRSYYRKPSTVEQNKEAAEILRDLGLNVDEGEGLGGFIFFNPSSSLEEVKENLDFLEEYGLICDLEFFTHCYILEGTTLDQQMEERGLKTPYDRKGYYIEDPGAQLLDQLVEPLRRRFGSDMEGIVRYQFRYARALARRLQDEERRDAFLEGSRRNLFEAYGELRRVILRWYREVIAMIEAGGLAPLAAAMRRFDEEYDRILCRYVEATLDLSLETGCDLPVVENEFFPPPSGRWLEAFRRTVDELAARAEPEERAVAG